MTGKELIEIIKSNHLENSEITEGQLTFLDDEIVMIYPIEFSKYSMWPTIPVHFDSLNFYEKCEWYEDYLVNKPRKLFSNVERIPKELYELVDEYF